MQTDRLDVIYRALGDPSRRAMLQRLAHARSFTVSEMGAHTRTDMHLEDEAAAPA